MVGLRLYHHFNVPTIPLSHTSVVFPLNVSLYDILFVNLVHEHISLPEVMNVKYNFTLLQPPHDVAQLPVQPYCDVEENTAVLPKQKTFHFTLV